MQTPQNPSTTTQSTIVTVGPDGTTQEIPIPAAAGQPVAITEPALAPIAIAEHPPWWITEPMVRAGMIASFVILLPISIALAIRMIQRPPRKTQNEIGPGVDERLTRLEQSIDAIAIEMERVSEGQRYVTKLLATEKVAP